MFEDYIWGEVLANIYQLREKVKNQSGAYDAIEKLESAIKNHYKLDKDIQYSILDIAKGPLDDKFNKWLDNLSVKDWLEIQKEFDLDYKIENETEKAPSKEEKRAVYIKKLYEENKLNDLVTKIVNKNPQMLEYFKNSKMNEKYNPLFPSKENKFVVMFHGTPEKFYEFKKK